MTIKKVVSFGFKHGAPKEEEKNLILDVRNLGFDRNPYHDKRLRKLRGTDKAVQEDVKKTPLFAKKYERILEIAKKDGIEILYLGCTGGHHRSVTLAELLSKDLGVSVEHRDILN